MVSFLRRFKEDDFERHLVVYIVNAPRAVRNIAIVDELERVSSFNCWEVCVRSRRAGGRESLPVYFSGGTPECSALGT